MAQTQVRGHEAVERGERVGRLQPGGRGRQLGVERVAGHGRAVEQRPRGGRQLGDLEPDGGEERGGQGVARVAGDPGELLEVERVARGLAGEPLAQPGVGDVADQLERRGVGERGEGDQRASALARAAWRMRGAGSIGRRAKTRRWGARGGRRSRCSTSSIEASSAQCRSSRSSATGFSRPSISSRERSARWQRKRSPAPSGGGAARPWRGGGEDRGEVGADGLDPARVQRRDVVVEGVDDEPEGHVALVLGGAAVEHEQAGLGGPPVHGVEQRALADAGLAEHGEDAAAAILDGFDGLCRPPRARALGPADGPGRRSCAASSVIGGAAGSASSDSMVATRPSQPEKSVSLPSAAVTRPVRASSASRSSSARVMFGVPRIAASATARPLPSRRPLVVHPQLWGWGF